MNRFTKNVALSTLLSISGCNFQAAQTYLEVPKPAHITTSLDKNVPTEHQEAVAFIEDVRQFGFEKLGLYKESKQFTKFVDEKSEKPRYLYNLLVTKPMVMPQERNNSVHLAEAKQYREEISDYAYIWSHADNLEDEAAYYEKQGYDVFLRVVSNYSSSIDDLGSPITPEFLSRSKVYQAQTIYHEICHDTIKKTHGTGFPSHIDEAYCALVEEAGAMHYFKEQYGEYSTGYADAVSSFKERRKFSKEVNSLWRQLHVLYNIEMDPEKKEQERGKLLTEVKQVLKNKNADNAELWDWYTYTKRFPTMVEFYESFDGDIALMMKKMEKCPNEEEKAVGYIRSIKRNK